MGKARKYCENNALKAKVTDERLQYKLMRCIGLQNANAVADVYLLHGMNSSANRMKDMGKALAKSAQVNVTACDARGHGARSAIGRKDDWEGTMTDYQQLIRSRSSHRPVVLVGNSLGGSLALSMLLDQPNTINGVVTVGAPQSASVFAEMSPSVLRKYRQYNTPTVQAIFPDGRSVPSSIDRHRIHLWHSPQDQIVPFVHRQRIADQLGLPSSQLHDLPYTTSWKAHGRSVHDHRYIDSVAALVKTWYDTH